MNRLHDKIALITGGNSGIGRAAALAFAAEGASVMIAARNADKAAHTLEAIRHLGGTADFVPLDVRFPNECIHAVEVTLGKFGRIDILFNNAGIVPFGTVLETPDQVWQDVIATNVSGTFYMSRAVLPSMIAQGHGVIINNASDWGLTGGQGAAAYAATKGAVVQFTRSMAIDHARQGIRVNAVCPGDTVVDRWRPRVNTDADFETYLAGLGQHFPIGRVGLPEEIAKACVFLASEESSYMTGQMLVIDGGNTAGGASTHYPTNP
ncbi:MAG: glucose 1-dehydrogenase [Anaerolineae bacterium]